MILYLQAASVPPDVCSLPGNIWNYPWEEFHAQTGRGGILIDVSFFLGC